MPPEICNEHLKVATSLVKIEQNLSNFKKTFDEVKDRFVNHINEGERPGGMRERVIIMEQTISAIRQGYWKTAVVAGIIGGLLGKISPDIFNWFIRIVFANG